MKKRILFVDDESRILDGLRIRFRRSEWDMFFVESGSDALEILNTEKIDVIVADMRMPQMDGATLLTRVQKEHPEVVRIVLSAYAELESVLRAIPVAHQFLNKPCDARELKNIVDRACSLHALVNSDVVRRTVGKIEKLPSVPRIHSQLIAALSGDNISQHELVKILKQDLAMSAKLLQVANSAFFQLSRSISRIEDAVTNLGFNNIKQLALTVEAFGQNANTSNTEVLPIVEQLQQHCLLVARIASMMFEEDEQKQDDAFVAGLLHDIGKLILISELPEQFSKVIAVMTDQGGTMHAVEERLFGVTHAEIGAYLLSIWGLPYQITEAAAHHHAPTRVEQKSFDILAAVHVANLLANDQMKFRIGNQKQESIEVDVAYLNALGVSDKLDKWRDIAKQGAQLLHNEQSPS